MARQKQSIDSYKWMCIWKSRGLARIFVYETYISAILFVYSCKIYYAFKKASRCVVMIKEKNTLSDNGEMCIHSNIIARAHRVIKVT